MAVPSESIQLTVNTHGNPARQPITIPRTATGKHVIKSGVMVGVNCRQLWACDKIPPNGLMNHVYCLVFVATS